MTDTLSTTADRNTVALADALATIAVDLHRLGQDTGRLYVHLSIVATADSESNNIATVDRIGHALFNTPGAPREVSDGGAWQHAATGTRGPINLSVVCATTPPGEVALLAQITELRAQLDAVRNQAAIRADASTPIHPGPTEARHDAPAAPQQGATSGKSGPPTTHHTPPGAGGPAGTPIEDRDTYPRDPEPAQPSPLPVGVAGQPCGRPSGRRHI